MQVGLMASWRTPMRVSQLPSRRMSAEVCVSERHSLMNQSITVDIPSCLSSYGHASFARWSACDCLLGCLVVLCAWLSGVIILAFVLMIRVDVNCLFRVACFFALRAAFLSCLLFRFVSKPLHFSSRGRIRLFWPAILFLHAHFYASSGSFC